MTLKELQRYLDREKWRDSERYGGDLCGRYVRCRYCDRDEPFPCAVAHNRLIEVISSPIPETFPDWMVPQEVYGIKTNPVPVATMKRKQRKKTAEPVVSRVETRMQEETEEEQPQVPQTVLRAANVPVKAVAPAVSVSSNDLPMQSAQPLPPAQPMAQSVRQTEYVTPYEVPAPQAVRAPQEVHKVISARSGKEGARVRLFSVKKKFEESSAE